VLRSQTHKNNLTKLDTNIDNEKHYLQNSHYHANPLLALGAGLTSGVMNLISGDRRRDLRRKRYPGKPQRCAAYLTH
ncbi:TPA: hypothetical protein ACJ2XA_004488, partial [Kluyvera georgiana]